MAPREPTVNEDDKTVVPSHPSYGALSTSVTDSVATETNGSTTKYHRIDNPFEKQRQIIIFMLTGIVFTLLGALTIWTLSLHFAPHLLAPTSSSSSSNSSPGLRNNDNDDDSDDEPTPRSPTSGSSAKLQEIADAAFQELNRAIVTATSSSVINPGCESTVLILRHCEKMGPEATDHQGNRHCGYSGYQRAAFLANQLFGKRWPLPTQLYALTTQRDSNSHWNFREWETLLPLSKKLGIDIVLVPEDAEHFAKFHIFPSLRNGDLCGKVTVISWKHSIIPNLANFLGCGPDNGCPESYPEDSFDQVWLLRYVYQPPAISMDDTAKIAAAALENRTERRRLHHHHHHHDDHPASVQGWVVYGSLTNQNFDPLAHSLQAGDYPLEGTQSGGRWQAEL
jgi:hypothetical protein